jgi:tRNA/rRNA methyltransferase
MQPGQVEIVLVRPSRPANVAAACRAMKNMGLGVLRIVQPPAGLDQPEARALAYGAWDVLDAMKPAATLAEAVAGAGCVAATSARPAADAWSPRRLAAEAPARAGGGTLAVVFGPESSGLRNDELELCPLRVTIPTAPEHPSLNLAQAVLIVAYEMLLSAGGAEAPVEAPRASVGETESVLAALTEALLAIGYLNPASPGPIVSELRGLLARAGATPRELALLRGLARQIAWAGGRLREGGGRADNDAPTAAGGEGR